MPQLGTLRRMPTQPNRPGTSGSSRPGNRPSQPRPSVPSGSSLPSQPPRTNPATDDAQTSGIAERAAKHASRTQTGPAVRTVKRGTEDSAAN
jgi:hypothetical protein